MTSESYQCSEFNIQIQNIGVMYYYEKKQGYFEALMRYLQ